MGYNSLGTVVVEGNQEVPEVPEVPDEGAARTDWVVRALLPGEGQDVTSSRQETSVSLDHSDLVYGQPMMPVGRKVRRKATEYPHRIALRNRSVIHIRVIHHCTELIPRERMLKKL